MSKTICHRLLQTVQARSRETAIHYKSGNTPGWESVTWSGYFEKIEQCAAGLRELGVRSGSRVALFSQSRWEWSVADFATLSLGAVSVPIYQSITLDDLFHILEQAQPEVVFVENKILARQLQMLKDRCPWIRKIVLFEKSDEGECFEQLLQMGAQRLHQSPLEIRDSLRERSGSELATIHFTSGTTGRPRGVLIGHDQIVSEVEEAFTALGVNSSDRCLSFLPYAHVLGRIEHWGHAWFGFTRFQAESLEKVRANLLEAKPTIMVAVPRVFEKVYGALTTQLQSSPWIKGLSDWAFQIGKEVVRLQQSHDPLPWTLSLQSELLQKTFFNRVKSAFGGELRFAVCGGAPLAQELQESLSAAGILLLEGYGLTETCGAVAVNLPFDWKSGTVGKPLPDVKVQIAQDGEILLQSRKIMRGYLNDAPQDFAEKDWFHTGDLGELLPSGHLRITGRKKDLIKTSGGKYVAPQRIENLLSLDPWISSAFIYGDNRKYIVALIGLRRTELVDWARKQAISFGDYSELTQKEEVRTRVRDVIRSVNQQLASYESIKRFLILPEEPSIESGELTPSLKLRRNVLEKKYVRELNTLYE